MGATDDRDERAARAIGRIREAVAALPPEELAAVRELAAEASDTDTDPDDVAGFGTGLAGSSTNWGVLGTMQGADIEALAFLVLVQSANSAQDDMKSIMGQVQASNQAKSGMRSLHHFPP